MTRRPDPTEDRITAQWRKSSFSGGGTGSECVELAAVGDEVYVRDSKDPEGPVLRFSLDEIRGFVDAAKAGGFDALI